MSAVRALALALAFVCFASGTALAQQSAALARALEAYAAGQLDGALTSFEAALAEGGRTPAELAQIHMHLGVLRGSLGDPDAARRAFEAALALEPDAPPPAELNPALREVFEAIRAERQGARLEIELELDGAPTRDAPLSGRARALAAPAGAIASIVVTATPDGASAPRWSQPFDGAASDVAFRAPSSAWSGAAEVVLAVRALDEHGNAMASAERSMAVPQPSLALAPATATALADEDDGGGFFSTAWPWVILGLLLAGAGATVAILFATASEQPIVGVPVVR